MLERWQDEFRWIIWQRGETYYHEGAVRFLRKNGHSYHAVVEGTEDYEVDIDLLGRKLSCTCPYARRGENCKHMAAVLMDIEDRGMEQDKKPSFWPEDDYPLPPEEQFELEALVESLSEQQLRDFVLEAARKHAEITWMLQLRFGSGLSRGSVDRIAQGIDEIVDRNTDIEGHIDDVYDMELTEEMCTFLDDAVKPLVEGKDYASALELLSELVLRLDRLDMEDFRDVLPDVWSECEYYLEIMLTAEPEVEEQVFESLIRLFQKCKYSMLEYVQEFLAENFEERFC